MKNKRIMFNDLSFSAWYEDRDCEFTVVHKYQGSLFESKQVNQQKKRAYIYSSYNLSLDTFMF
jgi:hypothetical protein